MLKPDPRASGTGTLRDEDSDLCLLQLLAWDLHETIYTAGQHRSLWRHWGFSSIHSVVEDCTFPLCMLCFNLHGYLISLSEKLPVNKSENVERHKCVQRCYFGSCIPLTVRKLAPIILHIFTYVISPLYANHLPTLSSPLHPTPRCLPQTNLSSNSPYQSVSPMPSSSCRDSDKPC